MEPYLNKRHFCTNINTPLFADVQVVMVDLEDTLQKAIFILQHMAKNLEWKFNQENLRR
jgi:hypothetical protein